VVLVAIGAPVTPARAQNTNWSGTIGSWFVPGNWSNGVPTGATSITTVGNGGTASIAGAAANAGGQLTINGGSTVNLQAAGSLVADTIQIGGNGTTGTLLLSGSTAVTGSLNMVSGTVRSMVSGTLTNDITISAGAIGTFSAATGQTLTLDGTLLFGSLSDAPARAVFGSATDTGTVALNAAITAAGPRREFEVAGGTLRLGSSLDVSSAIVDAGATLDYNGFGGSIGDLSGSGRVQIQGSTLGVVLADFGGTIVGVGGGLNVIPGGRVTLTGVNTYTGGTTIGPFGTLTLRDGGSIVGSVANSGNFNINSGGSMVGSVANAGNFNINSGGTLSLTGTLNGAGTTSLNGGTLRAATNSTVTNNVALGSGTTSQISAAGGRRSPSARRS
jgi:fibronectin-binding autotransporter adhesin